MKTGLDVQFLVARLDVVFKRIFNLEFLKRRVRVVWLSAKKTGSDKSLQPNLRVATGPPIPSTPKSAAIFRASSPPVETAFTETGESPIPATGIVPLA